MNKRWIVTRKADAAKVYEYQHPEPIEFVGMEFATHDHTEAVVEVAPAPLTSAGDRRVTVLGFRNRFTMAEKTALELAALDNPSAPMAQRQQSASLRATMKDQEAASFIDLDRADTRTGVQTLEAMGLLAAGRAAVILDAPVTDIERYRGAA